MSYLFPAGRSVEDFFNDMHSDNIKLSYGGNLGRMFFSALALGKSYKLTGYDYWYTHIRQIANEWRYYVEYGNSEDEFPF